MERSCTLIMLMNQPLRLRGASNLHGDTVWADWQALCGRIIFIWTG